MANKLAKEFSEGANHNFGSFTPKEVASKNAAESSGAKGSSDGENLGSGSPKSGNQDISSQGANMTKEALNKTPQGKAINAGLEAKQKLNGVSPINNAKQGLKADLKASVTGEDRHALLQEAKEKEDNPENAAKQAIKGKAVKKGLGTAGKAATGKLAGNSVGAAIGSKFTGALGVLKGAATGALGAVKGFFVSVGAAATKAGAAVGAFLHTSATVGTALVISGTVAVTSVPVAGGAGYFINQRTQRTDGCTPEEYDDSQYTGGAQAAVDWAIKIANDDSFNYGTKGTYGDPGWANRCGCYFCGTNGTKIALSGDQRYEKTYVCMTFVTAAYAHGAGDPEVLKICESCGSLHSHDGLFKQVSCFKKIGLMKDLTVDDLEVGDVFVHYASDDSSGHMSLYAGDGKMVDASGGSFEPDSIALRGEGSAEKYLRGTWNSEPENNFVMRYIGHGSHQSSINSATTVTSTYESGRISKSSEDVINGACAWGIAVAKDNRFHYGGDQKTSYNGHHCGCYFCGTNKSKPDGMVDKEYSYCCNPFVTAAFAHGGGDPTCLKLCQDGNTLGLLSESNDPGHYDCFKDMGHLSKGQLQKGDVLASSGHLALYIGDGLVAQAGSEDDNKKNSQKWNDSISCDGFWGGYSRVFRYIGSGGSPMFSGALYNEDVAEMTADDGCGGEMDGAQKGDTYVGKGMKEITAANGEKYVVLDADYEQVKKLGHQGTAQCYIYSIGYCDLILGGKFRCSFGTGETSSAFNAMRSAYGSGSGEDGNPGNIGGRQWNESSTDAMRKLAIKEIKEGRPVIFYVDNSAVGGSNSHWVCVCGWTASAGSDPKWDDLVCCDPAYAGSWGAGGHGDGLRTMKVYPDRGTHVVATFENWEPAEGQTRRSN